MDATASQSAANSPETAESVGAGRESMIRLSGVGKTYPDGTVAVHELDLDVRRGEMVCLVGPSGCGKSTTLKMINRLIEPTTGRIWLAGLDVTDVDPVELRRGIGYVIQQIGLFPHQRIEQNVMTVRGRLQGEFRRLQAELGKTVVLVTHDIDEAIRMGDRVAVFETGGRLAQYATPAELLAHPADEQVADFVGSGGLRTLTVTRLSEDHLEPLDGVRGGELGAVIDLDSSLEDALAALLREDKAMIGVKKGAQFVGVLTPAGVHRALRESLR